MSNAKLNFQGSNYKPVFKLSISEVVKKNGSEYEEIKEYYANKNQIIKNNNIIDVSKESRLVWIPEKLTKILIKSIDRITILDDAKSFHIELTVEVLE